jgi:putative membrane protein
MEGNVQLGKKLDRISYVISAVVIALVIFMRGDYKPDLGIDFTFIPKLNAIINSLVALVLLLALYFIKNKNIKAHQRSINVAMVLSLFFLLFYVLYHFTNYETKYCGEGLSKTIYFIVLISHIILAGVSLPFILMTWIRGFTGQITKHRKMTKWVFPVWFYVAITGPIVYLMLAPCY